MICLPYRQTTPGEAAFIPNIFHTSDTLAFMKASTAGSGVMPRSFSSFCNSFSVSASSTPARQKSPRTETWVRDTVLAAQPQATSPTKSAKGPTRHLRIQDSAWSLQEPLMPLVHIRMAHCSEETGRLCWCAERERHGSRTRPLAGAHEAPAVLESLTNRQQRQVVVYLVNVGGSADGVKGRKRVAVVGDVAGELHSHTNSTGQMLSRHCSGKARIPKPKGIWILRTPWGALALLTRRPSSALTLPASAFSSTLLPAPGGPSSSV
jgi:hypothetical protein